MLVFYWSSSSNANNTNNAWHVNFNNGNVNNNNKSNDYYVRAVRSGKCTLLSFESIYQAYLDCRRRKRGTINALKFEIDVLGHLFDLALELQKGEYRPSRSVCFVTPVPKFREIFAADFRDRVVHHLIVRELEKIWEPRFIYDSYSSRPGKGIHLATQRLQNFMQKSTKSGKRVAWYMQLDIRSFFMSMDREVLFKIFERKKTSDVLLYLIATVVFHNPTKDFKFKGDPKILRYIPAHKSLFSVAPGKGLPIGNLTSQFFANVYLNELDQYVKHELKCRFYIRYVDDLIMVHDKAEQLVEWRDKICTFLHKHLLLDFKDPGKLNRVSAGANFLGYIVRPEYILCRRRVVNNLKNRLREFEKKLIKFTLIDKTKVVLLDADMELIQRIRQVVSSYIGHFKHANCYSLVENIFDKWWWLNLLFLRINGGLKLRFQASRFFSRLKFQFYYYQSLNPGKLILVETGKYYESYDQHALIFKEKCGLKLQKNVRGMKVGIGFPGSFLNVFLAKLLNTGYVVEIMKEIGPGPLRHVKQRAIRYVYWPYFDKNT